MLGKQGFYFKHITKSVTKSRNMLWAKTVKEPQKHKNECEEYFKYKDKGMG